MNQETDEEENKGISPTGAIVFISVTLILILIAGYMLYTVSDSLWNDDVDHLRAELNSKGNVSEEYRRGWTDCVNELDEYRNRATNVTSGIGMIEVRQ